MHDILLVDDEPEFTAVVRSILEEEGHSVRTARDGGSAIAQLVERLPDVIILDVGMPGIGGDDVLACIRGMSASKDVPVVMLTSNTRRECVQKIARLGVSAYLSKAAFSPDGLMNAIRAVIAHPPDTRATGHRRVSARAKAHRAPSGPSPDRAAEVAPQVLNRNPEHFRRTLASITPVLRRSELVKRLAARKELSGLSPAVAEVLRLTSDPSSTVDSVAAAIGQDPALTVRIITLANSAAYSRIACVDSLKRAVVQIGVKKIRQAVLAMGIIERFGTAAFDSQIPTGEFWEHSLACGVIGAALARESNPEAADAAFIGGLLHDIGRVILAEELGAEYLEVIQTARRLHLPLEQVELRMLSMTHADIMGPIAQAWRLPPDIARSIELHHAAAGGPDGLGPHQRREILRVVLADRLAHCWLFGGSGNDTVYPIGDLVTWLSINPSTIRVIRDQVHRRVEEMKKQMLPQICAGDVDSAKDRWRSLAGDAFHPLLFGDHAMTDAHSLCCAELGGLSPGAPTFAVAQLHDGESPSSVGERLVAAERHEGLQRLPLLLIMTEPDRIPDITGLGNRVVRVIRSPVSVACLIAAVHQLIEWRDRIAA